MRTGLIATGVALLGGAVVGGTVLATDATAAPRPKDVVTIAGCARPVVPFCTTVSYRGTTYVLHGANPVIPSNTYVRVTGKPSGTFGVCPGTQMAVASWRKVKGVCPR
jgi:hypothetical protein